MREQLLGVMIPLGHNKYVLSDLIVAVEPLSTRTYIGTDIHGNKLRSRVLINHAEGEILASRTATTILKSMTKLHIDDFTKAARKIGEEERKAVMSEIDHIMAALVHCSTIKDAIEYSPYGRSKFYGLVKKHGIDTKPYFESTDDPDMFQDQLEDLA